jgi:hypothetical protein
MSRRIDFDEEALTIRFGGLDAIATATREVRVPYTAVASVSVGLTDPPGALALKLGLSTPPFGTTQRGRFRERGGWSFLDVDDRERTVILDLTGHQFRRVGLTVDDPQSFVQRLRERLPERG